MDTFKSELIETVYLGLIQKGIPDQRALTQSVNIVEGLLTRVANAERTAQQERTWAATQSIKLSEIRDIVDHHHTRMAAQGRTVTYEWGNIDRIIRGTMGADKDELEQAQRMGG